MKLAVIVSFLNEERYLPTLLASIERQTRPPDELLLVDDGSSDGSHALAAGFAERHEYARALRRPPQPPTGRKSNRSSSRSAAGATAFARSCTKSCKANCFGVSEAHFMQNSRRQFLRAAGVSLALPWLDAFVPARARGAAANEPPRRMMSGHLWFDERAFARACQATPSQERRRAAAVHRTATPIWERR